jgi:hypothetical protein
VIENPGGLFALVQKSEGISGKMARQARLYEGKKDKRTTI